MTERFGYSVIQWSAAWDPSLADLLHFAPELVLEKRVAIVACDSGPYRPSTDQLLAGWTLAGAVAISSEIAQAEDLPTPGFDEWYVFDTVPESAPTRCHVNQYDFSALDEVGAIQGFWDQIICTRPLHVLGAGTPNMFVVTRDTHLVSRIKEFVLPSSAD
ncbi:hypothetical protein HGB41_21980 [Massilia sp. ML15P13]|uniref:Uncharacterized protein n=2 Tax=Telluria aromaticivorans TaxID=2725995 RepID=A0A7Y2K3P5_9BURK|nr:hypothetical protein [Telluria aromaticivorans]